MEQQPRTGRQPQSRYSIELRAYTLWEERGRPWGTPDVDWFRAEHELKAQEPSGNQDAADQPLTVTTAKIVGAVLGSVTGVVAAVSNSLASE